MSKFYSFNQNNSGGSFDFDEADGITHWVIVEADSLDDAIKRAQNIGIYFDGCSTGRDCSCCGNRWYEPWSDDASEQPEIYGEALTSETFDEQSIGKWMTDGKEACVHYKDGRKEWF